MINSAPTLYGNTSWPTASAYTNAPVIVTLTSFNGSHRQVSPRQSCEIPVLPLPRSLACVFFKRCVVSQAVNIGHGTCDRTGMTLFFLIAFSCTGITEHKCLVRRLTPAPRSSRVCSLSVTLNSSGTPTLYSWNDSSIGLGSYGFLSAGVGYVTNITASTTCDGGGQSCTGFSTGMTCGFSCAAGYTAVQGSTSRTCTYGTWSGSQLTCSIGA